MMSNVFSFRFFQESFKPLITNSDIKVFGIGTIKTGTTTLGRALEILGFKHTHDNRQYLLKCLSEHKLRPIFKFVDQYDSFEDWPWPMLYKELDRRYPRSKFILTQRTNEDIWLQSVCKHSEWIGPSFGRQLFFSYDSPSGHEKEYLDVYRRHTEEVRAHFSGRPHKLLEVCWEEGDAWADLCRFLGVPIPDCAFPMLNTQGTRIMK